MQVQRGTTLGHRPSCCGQSLGGERGLRDGVFDTFEKFLLSYSISPHLGKFQTWVGNLPEHDGIKPNENYAREA